MESFLLLLLRWENGGCGGDDVWDVGGGRFGEGNRGPAKRWIGLLSRWVDGQDMLMALVGNKSML